jgi:hypothetical protein
MRVPTLDTAGHGSAGEGGGARARVRYERVGTDSQREEATRASRGVAGAYTRPLLSST